MPSDRKTKNKELPTGCRWKNGSIRLRTGKNRAETTLGKTLAEAYAALAAIELEKDKLDPSRIKKGKTISDLLDRYVLEVLPKKAPKTARDQEKQIATLRIIFGDNKLEAIEPQHIYQYIDGRKAKVVTDKSKSDAVSHKRTGKVAARREIALLSHAYTKAVEWGYIKTHPFKGEIRIKGEAARTRYVEDWEIVECLALPSKQKKGGIKALQAYIRLKLLLGLRMSDMLRLKVSDCKDGYLHAYNQKTKTPTRYIITEALAKEIELVKSVRPVDICQYLFCTNRGECYIKDDGEPSGWHSMWQRFMTRVLEETEVTERFTEHDLRAKVASDATTLEHAQKLLAHADSKITQRVYRRKIEIVTPAK